MKLELINKEQFLELYNIHQEYLSEDRDDESKRLIWNFGIDFKFEFCFKLNLRYANLSFADLSSADLRSADLRFADLSSANLDYSCLPLWCGSKEMILCDKLQAQLLGHIINVCKDVNFTDEQKKFVRDNWKRANEFLGERK